MHMRQSVRREEDADVAKTARMEMKEETEAGKRQVTTESPSRGWEVGGSQDLFPSQCPRPLPFLSPELDVPRAGLGE